MARTRNHRYVLCYGLVEKPWAEKINNPPSWFHWRSEITKKYRVQRGLKRPVRLGNMLAIDLVAPGSRCSWGDPWRV